MRSPGDGFQIRPGAELQVAFQLGAGGRGEGEPPPKSFQNGWLAGRSACDRTGKGQPEKLFHHRLYEKSPSIGVFMNGYMTAG